MDDDVPHFIVTAFPPRRDPEFRRRFQEMCAQIGVDPLASGKGFWSNMLDIGDFYYELGNTFMTILPKELTLLN